MAELTYKPKKFCDLFVETLDFHASCKEAQVNVSQMAAKLYDSDSDVSVYIRAKIDIYAMANSFVTPDYIRYKLSQIILTGEHNLVIQASKLLLGFEESPDKAKEFLKLIDAVKQNKETKG